MQEYLFTFRSVTTAMQAGRTLERSGIPHTMQRLPQTLRERGCGYGLKVRTDRPERANTVLAEAGTEARKLYQKTGDVWQEVAL